MALIAHNGNIVQRGTVIRGDAPVYIPPAGSDLPKKPVEIPESTMQRERSEAMRRVGEIVELHREQEKYALWCARRTAINLRDNGTRELGKDRTFTGTLAKQYNIEGDHHRLFMTVVECLLEYLPVTRAESDVEMVKIWKMVEERLGMKVGG